jgi:hypothetical protein
VGLGSSDRSSRYPRTASQQTQPGSRAGYTDVAAVRPTFRIDELRGFRRLRQPALDERCVAGSLVDSASPRPRGPAREREQHQDVAAEREQGGANRDVLPAEGVVEGGDGAASHGDNHDCGSRPIAASEDEPGKDKLGREHQRPGREHHVQHGTGQGG